MKKYVFTGKTESETLHDAFEQLEVTENDVFYKVKEQKSGLFKAKKIEVEIIKKDDINTFIKDFCLKLVTDMGFDAKIESKVRDDILNITIYSDNNNLLIGKDGKNMEALKTVVMQVLYNNLDFFYKFNLDVGEYKLKRQKKLERMAYKIARDVAKSKVEVKLDPMNSYERRIIHNALTNDKFVYTESVGEEPNRCVVIKIKEEK